MLSKWTIGRSLTRPAKHNDAELRFEDCREVGQGGPEACLFFINGRQVSDQQFDPSPLAYKGGFLIPVRRANLLGYGYALSHVDEQTLQVKIVSRVMGYMRLLRLIDECVEYSPKTYGDDKRLLKLKF